MAKEPKASGADDAGKCWLLSRSADLLNEAWRRGSAKELGLHTSSMPLIEHIQVPRELWTVLRTKHGIISSRNENQASLHFLSLELQMSSHWSSNKRAKIGFLKKKKVGLTVNIATQSFEYLF